MKARQFTGTGVVVHEVQVLAGGQVNTPSLYGAAPSATTPQSYFTQKL